MSEIRKRCALVVRNSESTDKPATNVLRPLGFEVIVASSYLQALSTINKQPVDIVLCAERLRDGGWKDLVGRFAEMNEAPPLVVLAEKTDSRVWAEAVNLGAQDVLAMPLVDDEVKHVVISATSTPVQRCL